MNYVISIINPKALPVVTDICTELGLPMTVVVMGHGTAVRSMLDLLGIESTEKRIVLTIANEEKTKRINQLLDIVKILNREIRGREENLSPVFIIGGMYEINSPFFLGRIKLNGKDGQFSIDTEMLKDTATLKIGENSISEDTRVGIVKNTFKNEKEIEVRIRALQ